MIVSTNSEGIAGKVVVITGASSGLGEATARHLSARGAAVVLGARRVVRIRAMADELTAGGGRALAVATDVGPMPWSQPEDVDINEILFRPTRQEL